MLQATQARLFGDPVDELARLAVLVAGGQMQRGQLPGRVLVQRHAFVHRHRGRETVLWGGGRNGSIRTAEVAFVTLPGAQTMMACFKWRNDKYSPGAGRVKLDQ